MEINAVQKLLLSEGTSSGCILDGAADAPLQSSVVLKLRVWP